MGYVTRRRLAMSQSIDATDSALQLADEHDVNLREVKGTGKGGRITKGDVSAYLKSNNAPAASAEEEE